MNNGFSHNANQPSFFGTTNNSFQQQSSLGSLSFGSQNIGKSSVYGSGVTNSNNTSIQSPGNSTFPSFGTSANQTSNMLPNSGANATNTFSSFNSNTTSTNNFQTGFGQNASSSNFGFANINPSTQNTVFGNPTKNSSNLAINTPSGFTLNSQTQFQNTTNSSGNQYTSPGNTNAIPFGSATSSSSDGLASKFLNTSTNNFPLSSMAANSSPFSPTLSSSSLTNQTNSFASTAQGFNFGGIASSSAATSSPAFGLGTNSVGFQPTNTNVSTTSVVGSPITVSSVTGAPTAAKFPPSSAFSVSSTSNPVTHPFGLSLGTSSISSLSQSTSGLTTSGANKFMSSNASPLASSSISAKKGLGGSPISDSSKLAVSKDSAQKISTIKQVKDTELQQELRESVETFKKFLTEQKKLREEIVKSNDVLGLVTRVEEESQILRQSISDVANGLQKIQVQSSKLKLDISKEQSNIKIAHTSSDTSLSMVIDRSESSTYFANKVRELENRTSLYLQEIEVVESMCNSSNKPALTTRELVEVIRKMDDEFIGLAAQLYMVHERVKTAKIDFLRRLKQANNNQNPFAAVEGRFGETFESISGGNSSASYKKPSILQRTGWKVSDNIGGSPFDNSCYINQSSSLTVPKLSSSPKPSIFGINNNNTNNNQSILTGTTTTTASPFSFSNTTPSFTLTKPTNLFLPDSVSNKKRR